MADILVHASLPKPLIISLGNIPRYRIIGSNTMHTPIQHTPIHLRITYGSFHPTTVELECVHKKPTYLVSVLSCTTFCNSLDVACQVPLSMGYPRQEYWRRLTFPPPGDIWDPGIKPGFWALLADLLPNEPLGKPI